MIGNRWNFVNNETGALGAGDQETFRGCSDVSIGSFKPGSVRPPMPTEAPPAGGPSIPTTTYAPPTTAFPSTSQKPAATSTHPIPAAPTQRPPKPKPEIPTTSSRPTTTTWQTTTARPSTTTWQTTATWPTTSPRPSTTTTTVKPVPVVVAEGSSRPHPIMRPPSAHSKDNSKPVIVATLMGMGGSTKHNSVTYF